MKKIICLMAAFVVCLSGGIGIATVSAEGTDEYAAAFSGQGRLTLVPYTPVDLPPEMIDPESPGISPEGFLGLSPDGKAILWGAYEVKEEVVELQPGETPEPTPEPEATAEQSLHGRRSRKKSEDNQTQTIKIPVSHVGVIRDGKITEFRASAARGDGDPFEKLDGLMKNYRSLPGIEELSWSADGRYVTISNIQYARSSNIFIDVPVVDIVDGEFWLADSYHKSIMAEDGGAVYISRFSRTGDYVYYLAYHSDAYQFCRCSPEGGNREVLWEQKPEDFLHFSLSSTSSLFETADGSWILSGINGTGRNSFDGVAMILFSSSGSRWTAGVFPTLIPKVISSIRFSCSDVSGYGVMTLMNQNTQSVEQVASPTESSLAVMEIIGRINLMRINTKDGCSWDIWCLQRTGENNTDLEMVSAAKYLQYMQAATLGSPPAEYPEGFDVRESMAHPNPVIMNACLSPDGRYTLLCVNTRERDETYHMPVYLLYLLDMETMEIRQVDAPEGTLSEALAAGTPYSQKYRPGMSWNPDGTIILINRKGNLEFYRLTVKN